MAAYNEQNHLALWVTGKRVEGSWAHADEDSSFYELASYVENIFSRIGLNPGMTVRKKSQNDIFVSGITIENRGGKKLVEMGILAKKVLKDADIDRPVYYAEMNWTALMKRLRGLWVQADLRFSGKLFSRKSVLQFSLVSVWLSADVSVSTEVLFS